MRLAVFFALGQALGLRVFHAPCVSVFHALRLAKRENGQKRLFFELKTHGIPDAKVMAGVVQWVATTSFGERLGVRQSFRLSVTLLRLAASLAPSHSSPASFTFPFHLDWHGFGSFSRSC